MGRNRKNLTIKNLKITDIAAEGKAIGRYNEVVVFVPALVPGDEVDVRITKKRKKYLEGIPIAYHQYSPLRIKTPCSHFDYCGGCKWQHLPYQNQLEFKQKQVEDTFRRIAKVKPEKLYPIIGSDKIYHYRNKLEFTFSNKRWLTPEEVKQEDVITERNALGFHIQGLFDKILDIDECLLMEEPVNKIRNDIRTYAFARGFSFFDIREHHGLMRNLIFRKTTQGELMLIVIFYEDDVEKRTLLMQHLADSFPEITSLMYIINQKANDSIFDQEPVLFKGKDHIIEKIGHVQFRIGPKSFFQTNTMQASQLYQKVLDFAALKPSDVVYDLYTGAGTIAQYVAHACQKVVGIEYIPEAIADARLNAELNKIENCAFFAGDLKDVFTHGFIAEHGRPDVVITDPPRAGMHADVVDALLIALPEKIVYVSCNPATQARDVEMLSEKYITQALQPVDMFPHTHHVENIALLQRKP